MAVGVPMSSAVGRIVAGDEAARAIRSALARFPEPIWYVRAEVYPGGPLVAPPCLPGEGEWLRCDRVVDDPDWLRELVRWTGRHLGTDDPVVASSLFVQNYAYRVLMVPIACMALARVVPDAGAGAMVLTISKGRPYVVGYLRPAALVLTGPSDRTDGLQGLTGAALDEALQFLREQAITNHLERLVETTRRCFRIGRRLLWGNIAASAAMGFRTIDGLVGESARDAGDAFFRGAPTSLQGLGSFYALDHQGRRGWYWERANCCLHDRLPGGVRCGDCSRTPTSERRAAYLELLAGGG